MPFVPDQVKKQTKNFQNILFLQQISTKKNYTAVELLHLQWNMDEQKTGISIPVRVEGEKQDTKMAKKLKRLICKKDVIETI